MKSLLNNTPGLLHGYGVKSRLGGQSCHSGTGVNAPNSRPGRAEMSTTEEHVVLANCVNGDGVLSSDMAYYSQGPPDGSPGDIASVNTATNTTASWPCAINTAEFGDTHVIFVATIGPSVADGGYAGTGNNGYTAQNGGFRCWQKSLVNLYSYQGRTCSGIYDCDHEAAPCTCDFLLALLTTPSPPAN